ncbi:MAG: hypothetical protein DRP01_07645 [Archaeoglobales archaeon]|nr:MAG: hypothetical protein DRP01_07645 [Archaeoglobales archaeon]
MEVVTVEPEYIEEEFTETVEEVTDNPEIDKQIEELQRQAEELSKQLASIHEKISKLMEKKINRKNITVKKKVAVLKCPRCSAENKLVVEGKLTIKVRCVCGAILSAV